MFRFEIVGLICLLSAAHAAVHELIVGTFSTKSLYTVEFDDEASSLRLIANTSVPYAGNWIAFSVSVMIQGSKSR